MFHSKMRPYTLAAVGLALALLFQNCSEVGFDQHSLRGLEDQFDNPDIFRVETPVNLVGNNQVDILFIVDNSGSMANYQKNMALRIDGFMYHVQDLDYRIAVTSTDPEGRRPLGDGKLYSFGGQHYLDRYGDLSDNQHRLGQALQMGIDGSGDERGINALYRAVEARSGRPEFFRDQAALAVVLISDEDECSKGCQMPSSQPGNVIDFVAYSFGNQKVFTFHSILHQAPPGKSDACRDAHSESRYGTMYHELTDLTGGIEGNICEASYAQQLSDIGAGTEALIRTVSLDCAPQDIDRDGKGDIAIFKNNQRIFPNFVLSGNKITFETDLTAGQYTFQYYCRK